MFIVLNKFFNLFDVGTVFKHDVGSTTYYISLHTETYQSTIGNYQKHIQTLQKHIYIQYT